MLRPLPWNVGFAVGHPEIDAQHRHLIQLINEIIATVEQRAVDRLPAMLSVFGTAAAEHFRTEISAVRELLAATGPGPRQPARNPRLLRELSDSGIDQHEAQHTVLLTQLGSFRTLPPPDLCGRLKQWFVDHAIRQDARLRPIFRAI